MRLDRLVAEEDAAASSKKSKKQKKENEKKEKKEKTKTKKKGKHAACEDEQSDMSRTPDKPKKQKVTEKEQGDLATPSKVDPPKAARPAKFGQPKNGDGVLMKARNTAARKRKADQELQVAQDQFLDQSKAFSRV